MKMLQAYYTSCRIGQTSMSGFQFYSYSDGFSEEELKELEVIGNYIAPLNLPSNPTEDEITNQFPIAFHYFNLKSGRVGVCQSTPLKQDYSGRPGNFLSHFLVVEDGTFLFSPILLYKSSFLRQNLSDQEWNVSTVPEKLPKIHFENSMINPEFEIDNIDSFICNNDKETYLIQIINSIINNSSNNRRIIISDEQAVIPYWISAITHSFPKEISSKLTFSTYSIDPGNNNSIICSTVNEGGRFSFNNEMVINFQFYVFNFTGGVFSNVDSNSKYAESIVTALTVSIDKLKQIFDFAQNFNGLKANQELDIFIDFYLSSNNVDLFINKWKSSLPFLCGFGTPEYLSSFLSSNVASLERLITSLSETTDLILCFNSLFKVLEKTNNQKDFLIIVKLYQDFIADFLLNTTPNSKYSIHIEKFLEQNKKLINVFDFRKESFIEALFSESYIKTLSDYIADSDEPQLFSNTLAYIINTSIHYKISIKILFNIPYFSIILDSFAKNVKSEISFWQTLISAIEDDVEYFTTIMLYVCDKLSNEMLKDLTISFSKKDAIVLNQINQITNKNCNYYFVIQPLLLSNESSPSTFFWKTVQDYNGIATKEQLSQLLSKYVYICSSFRIEEMDKLLQMSFHLLKSVKLTSELIVKFELSYPKYAPDDNERILIAKIVDIKKKTKTNTSCSIFELLNLGFKISKGGISFKNIVGILNEIDFNLLEKERQKKIFSFLYMQIIPLIKNIKDYDVYVSFMLFNNSTKLINQYYNNLEQYLLNREKDYLNVFHKILVFLSEKAINTPELSKVDKEKHFSILINYVNSGDKQGIQTLEKFYKKNKDKKINEFWSEIQVVANKRNNIITKSKKIINKFLKK